MIRRLAWTSLAMGAAFWNAGCATSADDTTPPDQTEQVVERPEAVEKPAAEVAEPRHQHRAKHRGGKGFHLMRAALRHVDLEPGQRTELEAMAKGLRDEGNRHAERKAHKAKMIAAIRSGDVAALTPSPEDIEKRAAAKGEKLENALDELHTILTPAQRKQLVDSVKEKMERFAKRAADHGGDRGDRARSNKRHGKVGGHRGKMGGHRGKMGFGRHGMSALAELDLTDDQRAALADAKERAKAERRDGDAMKKKMDARRERMSAVLAAFEKDDFDASTLGLAAVFAEWGKAKRGHKAAWLQTLVPLLTPEQRTKLADGMQKRLDDPTLRRGHRFGGHGKGRLDRGPRPKPGIGRPDLEDGIEDKEL